MHPNFELMTDTLAHSREFLRSVQYPQRLTLLTWREGNQHTRVSNAGKANVFKITTKKTDRANQNHAIALKLHCILSFNAAKLKNLCKKVIIYGTQITTKFPIPNSSYEIKKVLKIPKKKTSSFPNEFHKQSTVTSINSKTTNKFTNHSECS